MGKVNWLLIAAGVGISAFDLVPVLGEATMPVGALLVAKGAGIL